MQQLEPVFSAKRALTELDKQTRNKQAEITAINEDQNRRRENMKALKGSAEERTLTTRYANELNQQEDKLASL
jgi:predicted  nucleic acid-binding Zn-ribbon protein